MADRCDMPTASLRACQHPARYAYRVDGQTVRQLCAQHYRAGGHARMLRPRPWEYSRVVDLKSGMTVVGSERYNRKDDGA